MTESRRRLSVVVALSAVVTLAGCGGGGGTGGAAGSIAIPAQTVRLVDDAGRDTGRAVALAPGGAAVGGGYAVGDEFALPITLSDRAGVAGAEVRIEFDARLISCLEARPGDWAEGSAQVAANAAGTRGRAAVAVAGTKAGATGAGVLACFRMKALAGAKQPAAVSVSVVLVDAQARTIARTAVRPQVRPQQTGGIGDLLGTGRPEVGSAIRVLRVVVGLDAPPGAADLPKWDCNGSQGVDVGDAIAILRCVVGLDPWPITHHGQFDGSPTIDGVPIFPRDNPWNTDISAYPLHPNSATYVAAIGPTDTLHPDFGTSWEGGDIGIPYVVVSGSQAKVPVSFYYPDESDPGPYPIPLDAPVEYGSDRHILVLDKDNRRLYEVYDAHRQGAGWACGSGAIFDLTTNALRPEGWTSADAAGLPILPGLVRYEEVAAGEIRHAIRFTVERTERAYIHPATHFASDETDPSLPPMGLRMRLKADYDITPYTSQAQVVLRALKRYGMILADNGSNWYITGTHDDRWRDSDYWCLNDVPGSAFEAVDTGPIVRP